MCKRGERQKLRKHIVVRVNEGMISVSGEKRMKQKILIADDSEMNRSILADMLGDEYEILEAEDGVEAVGILQKYETSISLLLLDIVMPNMDGFEVLIMMNKHKWIDEIPVIMISSESAPAHVERAYGLGIADFISRPFDALIVHRRVVNTILLYAKQKKLVGLVADQMYQKERQASMMVDILGHIVEFRNGESGRHVFHIRKLTELLLEYMIHHNIRPDLADLDVSLICTASALHDIGKIVIPDEVLNKPGRLTDEEFTIMKNHTLVGAKMLNELPFYQDEPLIRAAYEICRWHHERYDGRGYPDGLKGDEIPISAQIVALADVYDALTSERVYKKAYSHEKSIQMIVNGECGQFNPVLLDCLVDIADTLEKEMHDNDENTEPHINKDEMRNVAEKMFNREELTASERTLQLLELERMKYSFFADMSEEVQFEYTVSPPMVMLFALGAKKLGLNEIILDPLKDETVLAMSGPEGYKALSDALRSTTPEQPIVKHDQEIWIDGEKRWMRIIARAMWSQEEPPRYTGTIGKVIDIHDDRVKLDTLRQMASHDALTGLFNRRYAESRIKERMEARPDGRFALVIFDLDHFKDANDNYGHIFGDQVLSFMAEKLRLCIRGGDIAARVGGDEFLIFLEYKLDVETVIQRIFDSLIGQYEDFRISVSMGIAKTQEIGTEYEELFHAADQALYTVKRSGRGRYCFYDESMRDMLSVISSIDNDDDEETDSDKETDNNGKAAEDEADKEGEQ